jgi:hypothetical protein
MALVISVPVAKQRVCHRVYTMTVEAHAVDVVEGTTTYRMYVDMLNATGLFEFGIGNDDNTLFDFVDLSILQ